MSQITFYLKLKPFVRQWLEFHFGKPVKFPPKSVENSTIRLHVRELPKGMIPEMQQPDEVAICIPESKSKPPSRYFYLGPRAKIALVEVIEDNFRLCLWNELWVLYKDFKEQGVKIRMESQVRAWCENHGISPDHCATIVQRFYRMKEGYKRKGIDLMSKNKEKDERYGFFGKKNFG